MEETFPLLWTSNAAGLTVSRCLHRARRAARILVLLESRDTFIPSAWKQPKVHDRHKFTSSNSQLIKYPIKLLSAAFITALVGRGFSDWELATFSFPFQADILTGHTL